MKILFVLLFLGLNSFSKFNEDQYYRYLGSMNSQLCSSFDMSKYDKLKSAYKTKGFYIPYRLGRIDKNALSENMGLLFEKLRWIDQNLVQLSKYKRSINIAKHIKAIEENINQNLRYKYEKEIKLKYGVELVNSAKKSIDNIKEHFSKIEDKLFYLKGFRYPVDHLNNRAIYEKYKADKNSVKKNIAYVKRKILEDGTRASKSSDLLFRTSLDTIKLELDKTYNFLGDDLRYDLEWLMGKLKSKRVYTDPIKYKAGFTRWRNKINDQIDFYSKILAGKYKDNSKEKEFATKALEDFVYSKEAMAYKYWAKIPDVYRHTYVLDTVLYNEVGSLDPEGVDKRDVLKTFINRTVTKGFNDLDKSDLVWKPLNGFNTQNYKWMNALFKKGQFSFTYHYFSAVKNIFCAPMSKWANSLRKKNLKLIKDFENFDPNKEPFKLFYYFSRVSMLGRINMTKIWYKDSNPISTRVGSLVKEKSLKKHLKEERFRYLFRFQENLKEYMAIEVKNKSYAVDLSNSSFYNLRDSNIFKFFAKK